MERESYSTPITYDANPTFERSFVLPERKYSEEYDSTSVQRWFHALPYGKILRNGTWRIHDRAVMESILDAFTSHAMPLAIDYNHQSMRAELYNGPLTTAGLVIGLGLKDDGLWALGKFTKLAHDEGAKGNVNFCSPVIDYNTVDDKTGKKIPASLFNLALATNPALDGLQPIQFSKDQNMAFPQKTAAPVAPPAAEIKGAPPQPTPPPAPAVPTPSADGAAVLQLLTEQVGCKSVEALIPLIEANMDSIVKTLKGEGETAFCSGKGKEKMTKEADTTEAQIAILQSQVSALSAENAAFKAEREEFSKKAQQTKIDKKIEGLFAEGKLLKELEAPARELFAKDFELGEKMFAASIVPMKSQAGADPNLARPTRATLNDSQKELYTKLRSTSVYARATEQELIDEIIKLESEKN